MTKKEEKELEKALEKFGFLKVLVRADADRNGVSLIHDGKEYEFLRMDEEFAWGDFGHFMLRDNAPRYEIIKSGNWVDWLEDGDVLIWPTTKDGQCRVQPGTPYNAERFAKTLAEREEQKKNPMAHLDDISYPDVLNNSFRSELRFVWPEKIFGSRMPNYRLAPKVKKYLERMHGIAFNGDAYMLFVDDIRSTVHSWSDGTKVGVPELRLSADPKKANYILVRVAESYEDKKTSGSECRYDWDAACNKHDALYYVDKEGADGGYEYFIFTTDGIPEECLSFAQAV